MRTIYIDDQYHCHVTDDGTMTAVETDAFDEKCDSYVEGYCIDPERRAVWPWKDSRALDAAQAQYEADQATMAEQAAELEDMRSALNMLGVSLDE